MEEDIQNYSTAEMFRGTPCTSRKSLRSRSFSYVDQLVVLLNIIGTT